MKRYKYTAFLFSTIGFIFLIVFIVKGFQYKNFSGNHNLINLMIVLIFLPTAWLIRKIYLDPDVQEEIKNNVIEVDVPGRINKETKALFPEKYQLFSVGFMFTSLGLAFSLGAVEIARTKAYYSPLIASILITLIGIPILFKARRNKEIYDPEKRMQTERKQRSSFAIIIAAIASIPFGLLGLLIFIKGIMDRKIGAIIFGLVLVLILLGVIFVIYIAQKRPKPENYEQ